MNRVFRVSVMLNLALLAGVTVVLVNGYKSPTVPQPVPSQLKPVATVPALPEIVTQPFRWNDLESSNGYRGFIANLRAVGCPEASIEDIVRGNVDRAYSWERNRLHMDGSGNGPWSQASEMGLINNLLGNSSASRMAFYSQDGGGPGEMPRVAPGQGAWNTLQGDNSQVAQISDPQSYSQNGQTTTSASSWFARGGTWNANAALTAVSANQSSGAQDQQSDSVVGSWQNSGSGPQVVGDPNRTPEQSSVPETSPKVQADPNDPYTMSAQDIMAQQLNQYYDWYQPQAIAATASGNPLFINPDAFHP